MYFIATMFPYSPGTQCVHWATVNEPLKLVGCILVPRLFLLPCTDRGSEPGGKARLLVGILLRQERSFHSF